MLQQGLPELRRNRRPARGAPGPWSARGLRPTNASPAHGWRGCDVVRSATTGRLIRLAGANDRRVHAVGDLVGRDDVDVDKAGAGQSLLVFGDGQGAGDTADPRAAFGAFLRGETVVGDD